MKPISIALVTALVLLVTGTAFALNPGDVVALGTHSLLISVDSSTGQRAIISAIDRSGDCVGLAFPYMCCTGPGTGNGSPPCAAVGGGDPWIGAMAVAVAADGSILVKADYGDSIASIYRVDPDTGDRIRISANSDGESPQIDGLTSSIAIVPPTVSSVAALPRWPSPWR